MGAELSFVNDDSMEGEIMAEKVAPKEPGKVVQPQPKPKVEQKPAAKPAK